MKKIVMIFCVIFSLLSLGRNNLSALSTKIRREKVSLNLEIKEDKIDMTSLYYDIQSHNPTLSHSEIIDLMYSILFPKASVESIAVANSSISSFSSSSNEDDYLGLGVNDAEFWAIVSNLWPWEYNTALNCKDTAIEKTKLFYVSNSGNDDADAFRHAYFAALLTLEFGSNNAKKLTDAHESYSSGLSKEMDLHNNSRGIYLYPRWAEYYDNGKNRKDNLASFITHCVAYGSNYNLKKYDSLIAPTGLVFTTRGTIDDKSFPARYIPIYVPLIYSPQYYGYKEQYYFEELTNSYSDPIIGTFTTKRLRTGYISSEYVVMSPRREGAGVAFLEYKFPKPIYRIDVELALWSDAELLRPRDCTAVFQCKDSSGNWITKLDLLNDIVLTTDRKNPVSYSILLDDNISEFRFYSTAPQVGASKNTGRLCIGTMIVGYFAQIQII